MAGEPYKGFMSNEHLMARHSVTLKLTDEMKALLEAKAEQLGCSSLSVALAALLFEAGFYRHRSAPSSAGWTEPTAEGRRG